MTFEVPGMKNRRQQTMLHIVQTRNVHSQEDLQALLKGRGFDVTQATISRDIKEMGLVKAPFKDTDGATSSKYIIPRDGASQASRLQRLGGELVESVASADKFVVIKTPPRCAIIVGSEIDKAGWPEFIGTIAGDDTILGICASRTMAARAVRRVKELKSNS